MYKQFTVCVKDGSGILFSMLKRYSGQTGHSKAMGTPKKKLMYSIQFV